MITIESMAGGGVCPVQYEGKLSNGECVAAYSKQKEAA